MKYFISVNDNHVIGMKLEAPDGWDGLIEITEEQFSSIELNKFKYTYIDGEVVQGEEIINKPEEPQVNEYKELIRGTHEVVETSSFDNLINMDMLLGLDDKLNKIMEHLGLEV